MGEAAPQTLEMKTGKGKGVEPFKPTRWKVRSSAIWSSVAVKLRTTEPVQQGPATTLVICPGRVIAKPFRLPLPPPFPQGVALGCYRVAPSARRTLNLTGRLPSGCGPLRNRSSCSSWRPSGTGESGGRIRNRRATVLFICSHLSVARRNSQEKLALDFPPAMK